MQANAVLAMARFQQAKPDDHEQAWQPAWDAARDGLAATKEHDLGETWVAWVITNCILEEARALFADQPDAEPAEPREDP